MPRQPLRNSSAPIHRRANTGPMAKAADLAGCMVALHPDAAAAKRLAVGSEPAQRLHVTLAYLGKARQVSAKDVNRLVAGWAASTPPIRGKVSGSGLFTAGPQEVAHASVDAPGLEVHRERLADGLKRAGLPISTDHGFTPHMTLAYGDGARDAMAESANGRNLPLTFDSVIVSHGGRRTRHRLTGKDMEVAKRWDPQKHPRDLVGRFRVILDEVAPGSGVRLGRFPTVHAWRSPEGSRDRYVVSVGGRAVHRGQVGLPEAAALALRHSGVRKGAGAPAVVHDPPADLAEPVPEG